METKTSTIFKFQIFYFQGRGILSILNCEYIFLYIYIYLRYEIWILWNLRHERQVQLTDAIIIFIVLNRNKNITVHYDDITEERWRNIRNINRKGFSKYGGYQQNELIGWNLASEVSIKFIVFACVINENYLVRWF